MKIGVQVPIKGRTSTRVPNKNFFELAGKALAFWLLDELAAHCPKDWDVYVDTESSAVAERLRERYTERFLIHRRDSWFAEDQANGNHLVMQFAVQHPGYDIYVQTFVTAVSLPGHVLVKAVESLAGQLDKYDSLATVEQISGWFWFDGRPINYDPTRPDGLPRSQDAIVLKETTGLYAATKEVVFNRCCRLGTRPLFYPLAKEYCYDTDTLDDLRLAERWLRERDSGERQSG